MAIWCLAGLGAAIAWQIGSVAEQGLLWIALILMTLAIGLPAWRARASQGATAVLVLAQVCLAAHLLQDDFAYRYVWLYSAEALPLYLKAANLWGGDEGTLLLLATLFAVTARRLGRWQGWAASGALLLAMAFVVGTLFWSPFTPTPAADLANHASLGMNAHLASPWMTLHPPLVFTAYVLLIAPVGGAIQALAGQPCDWPDRHGSWLRAGWLIISSGLVFGMWWAYEDFTFGQFWHWDPVQTSVFVVWALAGAQLHGLTRYRLLGQFRRLHPLFAGLTAAAALLSMVITRSAALASSHRYVGDSSLPLLLTLAIALLSAVLVALIIGWRKQGSRFMRFGPAGGVLLVVIIGMSVAAIIAAWQIAYAYVGALGGWPRPDSLKPFFETLNRWAKPAELGALRAAFDQWEIDRYAMNAWLAPMLIVMTLAGGHAFLPMRRRWHRWSVSIAVALGASLAAWLFEPTAWFFQGTGMTSSATRAIFPWLDGLAVTALYLLASTFAAVLASGSGSMAGRSFWTYSLPIGAIHIGVAMALIAGTAATVFDSYVQRLVHYPDDFGRPIRFADGFTVTVWLDDAGPIDDGARGSFQTIGRADWTLRENGRIVESRDGRAIYRDDRPTAVSDKGPVRLMCEILDYRYARYVSGDTEMIHPFIHRGLWRDVQVWLPAVDFDQSGDGVQATTSRVPVVLKVYPLMAWFWVGLFTILIGTAMRLIGQEITMRRRRPDRSAPESEAS